MPPGVGRLQSNGYAGTSEGMVKQNTGRARAEEV